MTGSIERFADPDGLGRTIRRRRRGLGLSLEAVAMMSGISRPTLTAIENGKETAHVGLVLRVCADLGITLQALTEENAAQEAPQSAGEARGRGQGA